MRPTCRVREQRRDHAVVDAAVAYLKVRKKGVRLLGHRVITADGAEAGFLVVAEKSSPCGSMSTMNGMSGCIAGGEHIGGRRRTRLPARHFLDEVRVVVLEYRQNPLLQGVSDVGCLRIASGSVLKSCRCHRARRVSRCLPTWRGCPRDAASAPG